MTLPRAFLSGIIEGFYGRCWSYDTRLAYADYLSDLGLNTCIYAPKSDTVLRKQWQERWPESQLSELKSLAQAYRQRDIHWGVGLSPFELYLDYGESQREKLKRKVAYLAELDAPLLAVLFDDMPGDLDALAQRQAEIVGDVCRWAPAQRVLVCPTYYSNDPALERFFGPRPANYWQQLGRELPADVDIFWTGNAVCSSSIEVQDIEVINRQLGRRVTLWDNYPVNDGAERSNFLYTSKLSGRSTSLRPLINGHLCNPMNQGVLSLPALSGLAGLYGNAGLDEDALRSALGFRTWERLMLDRRAFEKEGLSGMGADRCQQLAAQYAELPGAAAREITEWLQGDYVFDPACLTG